MSNYRTRQYQPATKKDFIFGMLFLGFLGIPFLLSAFFVFFKLITTTYVETDGVISNTKIINSTEGFRYEFSVDGKDYWGNSIAIGSHSMGFFHLINDMKLENEYSLYQKIKVYYNPDNIKDNLLIPVVAKGILYNFLFGLFIFIIVLSLSFNKKISNKESTITLIIVLFISLGIYFFVDNIISERQNNYYLKGITSWSEGYREGMRYFNKRDYVNSRIKLNDSCMKSNDTNSCIKLVSLLKNKELRGDWRNNKNRMKDIVKYKLKACELGHKSACK